MKMLLPVWEAQSLFLFCRKCSFSCLGGLGSVPTVLFTKWLYFLFGRLRVCICFAGSALFPVFVGSAEELPPVDADPGLL